MIRNPELLRHYWLELTSHRLIATPLVILLVIAVLASTYEAGWEAMAAQMAIAAFVLMTILWGGRKTYDTIVDEIRAQTWDSQRMSALTPWAMAWGKLLGGPLYAWYVGLYALAIIAYAYPGALFSIHADWSVPSLCLLLVLSALFAHGAGLMSGLTAARSGRSVRPARSLPLTLLGLLFVLSAAQFLLHHAESPILWYGMVWQGREFVLGSIAVFAAWTWFGAYRLMAEALALRQLPWGALAFVLFLTAYASGFIDEGLWSFPSRFAALGCLVGGAATYLEAWKERRDWCAVRRFLIGWRDETPSQALIATPSWVIVAAFTVIMSVVTGLLPGNRPDYVPGLSRDVLEALTLSPLVFALLMLRDIGLLYFFSLGARPERAGSTTVVYLVLLYLVLPALLNLAGLGMLAFPAGFGPWRGATWLSLSIAAGHVAIVVWLLRHRMNHSRAASG